MFMNPLFFNGLTIAAIFEKYISLFPNLQRSLLEAFGNKAYLLARKESEQYDKHHPRVQHSLGAMAGSFITNNYYSFSSTDFLFFN